MGIALWLLEQAGRVAAARGAGRVEAVEVRVGDLSGVEPDALQFAFEAAREAFPLCVHARLKVERVPLKVRCPACGHEGPPSPMSFACSGCGSPRTTVVTGEELELVAVEVDASTGVDIVQGETGKNQREGSSW
ncbi:MAG: hydrogenase maturation nickel metallochaperone HypA [Bacillota bacterium]